MVSLAPGHRHLAAIHQYMMSGIKVMSEYELPYDDRSPSDGELFSLELLHLMQGDSDREEFAVEMLNIIGRERRHLRYIDHLLNTQHSRRDLREMNKQRWKDWRFYEARKLSDEELRESRRQAEMHLIRAVGAFAVAHLTRIQIAEGIVMTPFDEI